MKIENNHKNTKTPTTAFIEENNPIEIQSKTLS